MPSSHRVVVTGIGITTSLGLDSKSTWTAILKGQSGISTIKEFDTRSLPCQFAGTIKNFKLASFKTKHLKKLDPFVQYGLQAAQEAIKDAGFLTSNIDTKRIGVSIGSGMGGIASIEKQQQNLLKVLQQGDSSFTAISAFFIPGAIINILSGICAIEYGFQGPNFAVVSACATGAHNIGIGMRYIADGEVDIMIVGGAEMASTPLNIAGFAACGALSKRNASPTEASRPWDKDRDGFVLSDGASILVLESYEHATRRGANIYGEILGFGMSADAYAMTAPAPSGKGAGLAIQRALKHARIEPTVVDYINAHATSTVQGDIAEIKAIESIWGKQARKLKISSTKSMTGHLLGAAGSLEAAFCLLAMRDQIVPPTINLHSPESKYSHLNLVPHSAQTGNITIALSNSFGFGGTNTSLVFRKL